MGRGDDVVARPARGQSDGVHREVVAVYAIDVCTPEAYAAMVIIETTQFTRQVRALFSDDSYAEMQLALRANPARGVLMPGTRGLRKLRWGAEGRGKRGGLRIIYFVQFSAERIVLLYCYAKNDRSQLSRALLRQLADAAVPSAIGE